jgi:hypothetical protein
VAGNAVPMRSLSVSMPASTMRPPVLPRLIYRLEIRTHRRVRRQSAPLADKV